MTKQELQEAITKRAVQTRADARARLAETYLVAAISVGEAYGFDRSGSPYVTPSANALFWQHVDGVIALIEGIEAEVEERVRAEEQVRAAAHRE